MNRLRNRTSSRAMSRPNMEKAIGRIKTELSEIIAARPHPGYDDTFRAADVEEHIEESLKKVKSLWY